MENNVGVSYLMCPGPPVCYQLFYREAQPTLGPSKMADLSSYCRHLRQNNQLELEPDRLVFRKINGRERIFQQEHYMFRRCYKERENMGRRKGSLGHATEQKAN